MIPVYLCWSFAVRSTSWQRLPAALEKVGMKVTDSTRSQGSMAVTYKPLSDSDWRIWALATRPGIRRL